jgi:uncharacterized protein Usg
MILENTHQSRVALCLKLPYCASSKEFSLTTAEILYRLLDHPRLLQTYVWQDYDLAPKFPKLVDFLDYWATNLDGPLHRVRVAHRRLIAPQEFRFVEGELRLN